MTDVHALTGAFAIDALDDDERTRFEEHLVSCADCRQEVAGLREAGAELSAAAAVAPPAALRDRVLADIATVRPLPPEVTSLAERRRSRARRAPLLAAAAAVAAVVGIGVVVTQPWADEPGIEVAAPDPIRAVIQAEDAETHASDLEAVDGAATATVYRSRELGQAVIKTENMPELSRRSVYQVWLRLDGEMEPAGLMDGTDAALLLEGDATDAEAIGVTVEPAGGSRRPTTQPLAYIPLERA